MKSTTLKSKLYAIVLASFVVRVVAFFALPNTPSSLGPDEGTYANAANWTALGKPALDFPDFGADLYVSGRSLLLPAAFFNKLGISPLDSIRLTSSLYGLLIVCLVTWIVLKTASKNEKFAEFINQIPPFFFGLFLIFTFLPSHFVWSILGLRESATEFWTLSVFILLFQIEYLNKRITWIATCGFLVSIVMVFSARPQVGWVLGATLILYLITKKSFQGFKFLLPVTILGIFLGYTTTVSTYSEMANNFAAVKQVKTSSQAKHGGISDKSAINTKPKLSNEDLATISPKATSRAEYLASLLCKFENQKVDFQNTTYICYLKSESVVIRNTENPVRAALKQIDAIPDHHEVNKIGAESEIKTIACPKTGFLRIESYFCIAYRAPYTTFTFLFRPILGGDITSSSSGIAALENVFWLAAFIFVIIVSIRNRGLASFHTLIPSLLFFSLYSVGAGAYEGNMGTAFRHKALILWVLILLLGSTVAARRQLRIVQGEISRSFKE